MTIEFSILDALLLTGVGFAAGFVNVVAGGGSTLSVPVMVFMGLPAPIANGTNRIAILAQNLVAISTFFRRGFSDFKLSLSLALCTVPGAAVGALIGVEFEGIWFNRILALIMAGIMLANYFRREAVAEQTFVPSKIRLVVGHVLMVFVGFWGGFIQIGVGFLIMPILSGVMGLDLVRTNMHKVFIIAVYTALALGIFASRLDIAWIIGVALALGNMLGGYIGARSSISGGDRFIRFAMNIVMVCFIARLLFFN